MLCALDLERPGSASLGMASLLGEYFEASVDALYATPPRCFTASAPEQIARLVNEHTAQERLSAVVASVTRKVRVSSYVTSGPASAVILTHSERYTSDLIVMASSPHRRAAISADTIAPVSEHAPCAVLTVGDRFQPAALRRILLPVGPAGVEKRARSWVTTLASRFDAEVGLLRIEQPRSGVRKALTRAQEPVASASRGSELEQVLAALCCAGVDAYEIAHPGGDEADALARLCEIGGFDAIVFGLSAPTEGAASYGLVSAVRQRTSAPVLSVRSSCSPMLFAPSCFELSRNSLLGSDWAQSA